MTSEGLPKPERVFTAGEEVIIPESYVNRGIAGYADQKADGWFIEQIFLNPEDISPLKGGIPYAIVREKKGMASKHIPLEDLRSVNP